jgi:hypothetical protein
MWRVLGAITPKSLHETKILRANPPILLLPGPVLPVGDKWQRVHRPGRGGAFGIRGFF